MRKVQESSGAKGWLLPYHVRQTFCGGLSWMLTCTSCVCKHQYCHLCEAVWKTCDCAQYPGDDWNQQPADNDEVDRWNDWEPNDYGIGLDDVDALVADQDDWHQERALDQGEPANIGHFGGRGGHHGPGGRGGRGGRGGAFHGRGAYGDGGGYDAEPYGEDNFDDEESVPEEWPNDTVPHHPARDYGEVRRRAEVLRTQHGCERHDFRFVYSPGHCDVCGWHADIFHHSCQGCRMQTCRSCSADHVRAIGEHEMRRRSTAESTNQLFDELSEVLDGMFETD